MCQFDIGDRVRVDIPDETDIDHHWHGAHGTVVEILADQAGAITGNPKDSVLLRVELDDHNDLLDFRSRDLRPPIDE